MSSSARRATLARSIDAGLNRFFGQHPDLGVADPIADVVVEVLDEHVEGSLPYRLATFPRASQALVGDPIVECVSDGRLRLGGLAGESGCNYRMVAFPLLGSFMRLLVGVKFVNSFRQPDRRIRAQ